eukprot:5087738-Amphidinium_carterae.1
MALMPVAEEEEKEEKEEPDDSDRDDEDICLQRACHSYVCVNAEEKASRGVSWKQGSKGDCEVRGRATT